MPLSEIVWCGWLVVHERNFFLEPLDLPENKKKEIKTKVCSTDLGKVHRILYVEHYFVFRNQNNLFTGGLD